MASVTITSRITAGSEQSTINVLVFDTGGGVYAQGVTITDTGGNPVSQATTLPAAGAAGLVVRPLAMTDGSNSMPTMDAAARAGFVKLTDGLSTALLDSSGFLKVNVAANSAQTGTSSTFNVGFPSAGTAAGFMTAASTMVPGLVDASGFLKVNVAAGGSAGGTASTFGLPMPGLGTAVGFSDGANMLAGQVATSIVGANVYGLITRPYPFSDGTHTVAIETIPNPLFSNPGVHVNLAGMVGFNTFLGSNIYGLPLLGQRNGNIADTDTKLGILQTDGGGALKVNIVSGYLTSVGGGGGSANVQGTQFGAVFPATGLAIGFINTASNMVAGHVDASGFLMVNIAAGGGSGGTALADAAAMTAGSTLFTPIGGVYNDAIATAISGTADWARITEFRALHVNPRTSLGGEIADPSNLWLRTSNQTLQDVDGTWLAGNAISPTGKPVIVGGWASTATPVPVTADGDAQWVWVDRYGRVRGAVEGVSAQATILLGNPVLVGGYASSTTPSAVASGTLQSLWLDPNGRLNVTGSLSATTTGGVNGTQFGAALPATGLAIGFINASSNMVAGHVDSSGYLLVNVGSGLVSSSGGGGVNGTQFGTALPATGLAIGFINSASNMVAGHVDSSGFLLVNIGGASPAVSVAATNTYKGSYGTPTGIAITLGSLVHASLIARSSAVVDNTADKFLDALVVGKFGLGTVATPNNIQVYTYGSIDGINYTENVSNILGTDASYSLNSPTALQYLGTVPTPTSSQMIVGGPWSVAAAFNGILPQKWGIVVLNSSGGALTAGNSTAFYQGIYRQAA